MSDLLNEVLRRAEANWGDGASEGPYCKQEILSDLREIADAVRTEVHPEVPAGAPLDPETVPYLDWLVWLRDEGLTCQQDDCQHCRNSVWTPVTVSETGYTSLRKILAELKAHAEDPPPAG